MKYTYRIETYYLDKWWTLIEASRQFCEGFIWARKDDAPHSHFRLIRSDDKIVHDLPAVKEVSVGMVAGFPTPEQYERAAQEALAKAAALRSRIAEQELRIEESRIDRTVERKTRT